MASMDSYSDVELEAMRSEGSCSSKTKEQALLEQAATASEYERPGQAAAEGRYPLAAARDWVRLKFPGVHAARDGAAATDNHMDLEAAGAADTAFATRPVWRFAWPWTYKPVDAVEATASLNHDDTAQDSKDSAQVGEGKDLDDAEAADSQNLTKGEEPETQRAWWHGYMNIYLAFAVVVLAWFISTRNTPFKVIGPCRATHIVAAALFALICFLNIFHTPSHGPLYRTVHKFLGRVALGLTVVLIVTGSTDMVHLYHEGAHGWLMMAALSMVSLLQVTLMALGVWALWKRGRDKDGNVVRAPDYKLHAIFMQLLTFGIVFAPSFARLPQLIGVHIPYWIVYQWVLFIPMAALSIRAHRRGGWY